MFDNFMPDLGSVTETWTLIFAALALAFVTGVAVHVIEEQSGARLDVGALARRFAENVRRAASILASTTKLAPEEILRRVEKTSAADLERLTARAAKDRQADPAQMKALLAKASQTTAAEAIAAARGGNA